MTRAEFDELAILHYGITNDVREAGYILRCGSMLDFSGRCDCANDYRRIDTIWQPRKTGQRDYLAGRRTSDHREICGLFTHMPGGSDGMFAYMLQSGAIRIGAGTHKPCASLIYRPTRTQATRLAETALSMGGITIGAWCRSDGHQIWHRDIDNGRLELRSLLTHLATIDEYNEETTGDTDTREGDCYEKRCATR